MRSEFCESVSAAMSSGTVSIADTMLSSWYILDFSLLLSPSVLKWYMTRPPSAGSQKQQERNKTKQRKDESCLPFVFWFVFWLVCCGSGHDGSVQEVSMCVEVKDGSEERRESEGRRKEMNSHSKARTRDRDETTIKVPKKQEKTRQKGGLAAGFFFGLDGKKKKKKANTKLKKGRANTERE